MLAGKKTYIVAAIGAALTFVQIMGWFEVPAEVWAFLGLGGLATLRAGVAKKAAILMLALFIAGCAQNKSFPDAGTVAEESGHWTDGLVIVSVSVGNGQAPSITATTGEGKDATIEPGDTGTASSGPLVGSMTINVDVASGGAREGAGSTQAGGTVGSTDQDSTQTTTPSLEIPASVLP